MKNEKTSGWLWPVCSAALAAVCALIRRWQLSSAFEGELKLPVSAAPASMALGCVLVIAAALTALLALRQSVSGLPRSVGERRRWRCPLAAPGDTVSLTVMVAAAFLALAAAPLLFREGMTQWNSYRAIVRAGGQAGGNNGVLLILTAVTCVIAFFGLLLSARAAYRGTEKGRGLITLPAINGCIWLMESYRGHAADPVLWDYVPLLLSIVCGMLFYLDCAGLSVGAPHPRRALWLGGMTVVLSAVALVPSGGVELSGTLLTLSQLLAALCVLWRLPGNLVSLTSLAEEPTAEGPTAPEQPHTQEIQEDTTHE